MSETGGPEHDFEPVPGLPAHLPKGEHIVWQGRPELKLVMRYIARIRWIAGYFAVLAIWTIMVGINDGEALGAILLSLGYVGLGFALVYGLAYLFARGIQKTTLYTITNARVVMRVGIALSASFNLPFKQILGADMRLNHDQSGDIALALAPGHGLSSAVFWPHQKGAVWKKLSPQMICLPDAKEAAEILALQLKAYLARNAGQNMNDEQAGRLLDHNQGAKRSHDAGLVAAE